MPDQEGQSNPKKSKDKTTPQSEMPPSLFYSESPNTSKAKQKDSSGSGKIKKSVILILTIIIAWFVSLNLCMDSVIKNEPLVPTEFKKSTSKANVGTKKPVVKAKSKPKPQQKAKPRKFVSDGFKGFPWGSKYEEMKNEFYFVEMDATDIMGKYATAYLSDIKKLGDIEIDV